MFLPRQTLLQGFVCKQFLFEVISRSIMREVGWKEKKKVHNDVRKQLCKEYNKFMILLCLMVGIDKIRKDQGKKLSFSKRPECAHGSGPTTDPVCSAPEASPISGSLFTHGHWALVMAQEPM